MCIYLTIKLVVTPVDFREKCVLAHAWKMRQSTHLMFGKYSLFDLIRFSGLTSTTKLYHLEGPGHYVQEMGATIKLLIFVCRLSFHFLKLADEPRARGVV